MLCLTGRERNPARLNERLARYRSLNLQEVRLDHLERGEIDEIEWPAGSHLIVTCRARREGGQWNGSEGDRVQALKECILKAHPAWIDVELTTPLAELTALMETARAVGTRVLLSHHEFEPGKLYNAEDIARKMCSLQADGIKLAWVVEDAADLAVLRAATSNWTKTKVIIGMGPAGVLSRVLYDRLGSAWTYVVDSAENATAQGQLTLQQARGLGMPMAPGRGLYVLLGGSQVMESPGPRVYNRLFEKMSIDACYLPVVTDYPERTMPLLRELGFKGASVTMPLKERVFPLLSSITADAERAKSVNTITLGENGELVGDLTDGAGALRAIQREIRRLKPDLRAVILGSGATARAIGASLKGSGLKVVLLGRNLDRAKEAAKQISVDFAHLSSLGDIQFDILVNGTPVGMGEQEETPVDDPAILQGKVVLDVVHGKETQLQRDTLKHGGIYLSGNTLWVEQGRLQLKAWFGLDVPARELEVDS